MEFRKEIRERRKAKKRQMQLLLIKVKQSKLLDNKSVPRRFEKIPQNRKKN